MSWPTTPLSTAMEELRADPSRFYTYGIYNKNISHDHFLPAKRLQSAAETLQRTAVASIGSGVIFGGFSAFMGMFAASAMATDPTKTPTVKETFIDLGKTIGTRFKGGFKSGLTIGAAFAFAEPAVESVRSLDPPPPTLCSTLPFLLISISFLSSAVPGPRSLRAGLRGWLPRWPPWRSPPHCRLWLRLRRVQLPDRGVRHA